MSLLTVFSLKILQMLLLAVVIIGSLGHKTTAAQVQQCTWYGECGKNADGHIVNCAYDGPPKLLEDAGALDILQKNCPWYFNGSSTYTCCAAAQIRSMTQSLGLGGMMLGRCPTCFRNFVKLWCASTCDPYQAHFIRVHEKVPWAENPKKDQILSIDYIINEDYANRVFNSCKNVQMPSGNERAIGAMCGTVSAAKCTVKDWLGYQGSTQNPVTPFPIYFNFTKKATVDVHGEKFEPRDVKTVPCWKPFDEDTPACSCQDCVEACVPLPPKHKAEKWQIIGIDGAYVVSFIIFIVFFLAFMSVQLYYHIVVLDTFGFSINNDKNEDGDSLSVRVMKGKYRHDVAPPVVRADQISCIERIGMHFEEKLENLFRTWGSIAARRPIIVLIGSIVVSAILCCGIPLYQVITDPVELWSSPDSQARLERNYFNEKFAPFYRTEQLIIRKVNGTSWKHENFAPTPGFTTYGPVLEKDFLLKVLDLQLQVESIAVWYEPYKRNITLKDICFKPLSPDHDECAIMSVLNYWQNNATLLNFTIHDDFFTYADYTLHLENCLRAPMTTSDPKLNQTCLGKYGGPVFPWVALGGYAGNSYRDASALVITFSVNNSIDANSDLSKMALLWEGEYLKLVKDFIKHGAGHKEMEISYSAERSIEDELTRESNSDVLTILISYLIMFAYISLALGENWLNIKRILIDSKMTLGLCGVLIVLLSVGASLGFFSYCGVPMTLIIIEVVPFLVLAVGVDNIFILVQTYQRNFNENQKTEDQISWCVGKVGPSMLLTSLSESLAFFLGALTTMPAVKMFSLYAAGAVLVDFLLQITAFVALLSLDARRQRANRIDVACCVRANPPAGKNGDGFLFKFFKNYYSRFLMADWVRVLVMVVFMGWFFVCAALMTKVEAGLDQKLSMPEDSYVLRYFDALAKYLKVGPPVYFVVERGHDYETREGQNMICGGSGCPQNSLAGQVAMAAKNADESSIAVPASIWLDDFFDWTSPGGNPPCCRYFDNDTDRFCPATVMTPTNHSVCHSCDIKRVKGRPVGKDFMRHLPWFLRDNPGIACSKGGHAAYGTAVELMNNKTAIGATYFMSYHTILKTSSDFINALKSAHEIAANVTKTLNVKDKSYRVFPYSIFYVFYEQYLHIVHETWYNLLLCCAAVFGVTFILLGFDVWSASVVLLIVAMIIVNLFGLMYMWNITLNAISLVNLVMAVGISVEFCSHIVRDFAISCEGSRVMRAKYALSHMGSSVFSGITLTKLGGIIVLAFSKSQLFQVFYFRMYLGIVVFGALHGLVFLPVFLSYCGPSLNKAKLYKHQQQQGSTQNNSVKYDDGDSLVNNAAPIAGFPQI